LTRLKPESVVTKYTTRSAQVLLFLKITNAAPLHHGIFFLPRHWLLTIFSLLHQVQQFGDEFSSSMLSNQIRQFLVSVRRFCVPVKAIQTVNGCKFGLQFFQSSHAFVVSISVPKQGIAAKDFSGHDTGEMPNRRQC
jgi:hypothetical protein